MLRSQVAGCGSYLPARIVANAELASQVDTTDKLDEYQGQGTIRLILFVEPGVVLVKLYRRDESGAWEAERYEDLEDVIDLPEIGSALSLRDIYLKPSPQPDRSEPS